MPGSLSALTFQDHYQDNLSDVLEYDPENAKKLLEDAGYSEGSDGIYEKDGEKLSLRYVLVGDDEVSKSTASAVQSMLRAIGVDLRIEERPASEFANILEERDFDLFLSAVGVTSPYSGIVYFEQSFGSDSNLDLSSTGSAEFDEKIKEMQQLDTKEAQIERANELETEVFERYGHLPYANGPQMSAYKKGLANFGPAPFKTMLKEDIGWEK